MRLLPLASLLHLLVGGPLAALLAPSDLAGHWEGAIVLPPGPMAIRCDFASGDGGKLQGTLDIPAQGAIALPLQEIEIDGAAVRFAIAGIPGDPRFAGNIDGDRLAGRFTQNGGTFEFHLEKRGAAVAAKRPQVPTPPFPYRELEVRFGHGETQLAGTLTLPPGEGPFPALMLFSGSGAQDRDSTVAGHKPFLVLADRLARAGFAVLRADDRGVGGSSRDSGTITLEDFIDDARAGIRFLAARPDIDASRLGMYGHSQGATVAGDVAAQGELDFVILAAGPGVQGSELSLEQGRRLALAAGIPPDQVERRSKLTAASHQAIMGAATDQEALDRLVEMGMTQLREQKSEATITAADREFVQRQAQQHVSPWIRHYLSYDPAVNLAKVRVPVLVLQGDLDLQVWADQNVPKSKPPWPAPAIAT